VTRDDRSTPAVVGAPVRTGRPDWAEIVHLRVGFGDRIRTERAAAGLTQAQLATLTGLNVRTIERFEAGELRPTKAACTLLALVFRRPVQLVKGADPDPADAFGLVDELESLAGESLAAGGVRELRTRRISHLLAYGVTREERNAEQRAALDKRVGKMTRQLAMAQAERALRSGTRAEMRAAYDELAAIEGDR
jgi:transcriptional regulator with XRE-family HTH domain